MSELTREQVHELADRIAMGQLKGYINQWLDHDAALRARVAGLERTMIQQAANSAQAVKDYAQQLATVTAGGDGGGGENP